MEKKRVSLRGGRILILCFVGAMFLLTPIFLSFVCQETAEGALIINQKFKKVDEKIIDSVRMLGYRILIQKSYIKRVSKLKTLLQRSTHNPMGADSINKGYN